MEIYFDNAATTRCSDSVIEVMTQVLRQDYGNPSSLHKKGLEAEKYIRLASEQIARTLKVKPQEIFFTSGGTESNNIAIIGGALANHRAGKHIITTRIEHPAVLEPMKFLEDSGFDLTYLNVDKEGHIDLQQLEEAISTETILVSIMSVNNEIGAVEPLEKIGAIIKAKTPKALFHVDAIQAYGKMKILPKALGIDLLSVSGHKIHGPKGVGFLYAKEKTKLSPITFGGRQQKGLRPGTENVPGIAGLGQAAVEAFESFEEKKECMFFLRERFIKGLETMEFAHPNGRLDRENAPHILSVAFEEVRSEVLLHALEDRGIYVSSGSACASNRPKTSETLKQIGVKKEYLDTTLRFSFSRYNTVEEVEVCLKALGELVPILQRYTRH